MNYRGQVQKDVQEALLRSTITNEVIAEEIARREDGHAPRPFAESASVTKANSTAQTGCMCEQSEYCVTVLRAAEWNERRPADRKEWKVPDWVVLEATIIEARCEATIHYPTLLAQTWYGNDVFSSVDEERTEQVGRQYEDDWFAETHREVAEERWEGEYDSYESQDEFVKRLTAERRRMLVSLMHLAGQDPADPKNAAWVRKRIAERHGNVLRGYSSCIYSLKRRLEVA